MSEADDMRNALSLLIKRAGDRFGPFIGAGTLGFTPEDCLMCSECGVEHWVRAGSRLDPMRDFPHAPNCEYVRIMQLMHN